MNNILFKRALENRCPICNRFFEGHKQATELVEYKEGKLKIHKEHIKYKRQK